MEWIDINEQLPQVGQLVIAWRKDGNNEGLSICKYKYSRDNWKFKNRKEFINVMSNYPFRCEDVTHWMIFPTPPKTNNIV